MRRPTCMIPTLVFAVVLAMLAGCGNRVVTTVHSNDYTPPKKIAKVALYPLMVFSSSQTEGHESPNLFNDGLVTVKFTTRALSAAEYLPAQAKYAEKMSESLAGLEVVRPDAVQQATEGQAVPTFEDSIRLVAEVVGADAVATMKLRKVNLAGGDVIHGSAGRGSGHLDVDLYCATGTLIWSLSGDAKYQKGTNLFNILPDPAPTLSDFTGFTLDEIKPEIVRLMAPLRQGQYPEEDRILGKGSRR